MLRALLPSMSDTVPDSLMLAILEDSQASEAGGQESEVELNLEEEEEEFGEAIVTACPQTSIASGESHAAILNHDGTVTVVGSNEKGRAETTGWSRIAAVAAGNNCTIGIREDETLAIAGDVCW